MFLIFPFLINAHTNDFIRTFFIDNVNIYNYVNMHFLPKCYGFQINF